MKLMAMAIAVLLVTGTLSACGSSESEGGSGGDAGPVVIGASGSLTGGLSTIGALLQKGYAQRVKEVNDAGGLDVGGTKRKVELKQLDNKSEPNLAAQQARTLVTREEAVALLGSNTPPINNAIGAMAETLRVPLVMGLNPIRAFLSGSKSGWNYAWDQFFDEQQATTVQYETANLTRTNKKVALFTDNEQDGIAQGKLWTQNAKKYGYTIAYHAKFPVGTTDFSSFIRRTKSSGADIVIAQMIPPDGVALWKQFKALSYRPKLAFCEKCGTNSGWNAALKSSAEGTSGLGNWLPRPERPETQHVMETLGKQIPNAHDLGLAVSGYTAASILFDAIQAAGSTEPDAINEAIGRTDKEYPVGRVKFKDNAYGVEVPMLQWQGGNGVQVYPPSGDAKLETPVAGLG